MPGIHLLLISGADILVAINGEQQDKTLRLLTALSRQGYYFLATAPHPDRLGRKHGNLDDALLGTGSLRKRLSEAGGVLDGVYYVRRSLLTQKRDLEAALHDILQRYAATPERTVLLSSKRKFVNAAHKMGIEATLLDREHQLVQELAGLNDRGPALN